MKVEESSKSGYATKLVMQAKLAKGGSMYIRELTDYPGIAVIDTRDTRFEKITRKILYKDSEYATIQEAINAYKPEDASGPKTKE